MIVTTYTGCTACCTSPTCSLCASMPSCMKATFSAPGLNIDGAIAFVHKVVGDCTGKTPTQLGSCAPTGPFSGIYDCTIVNGQFFKQNAAFCPGCGLLNGNCIAALVCCSNTIRVAYTSQVGNNSNLACLNTYDNNGNRIIQYAGYNTLADCTAPEITSFPTLNVISNSPFLAVPSFNLQFQKQCIDCGSGGNTTLVPVGVTFAAAP
jgi:hypothetical protein